MFRILGGQGGPNSQQAYDGTTESQILCPSLSVRLFYVFKTPDNSNINIKKYADFQGKTFILYMVLLSPPFRRKFRGHSIRISVVQWFRPSPLDSRCIAFATPKVVHEYTCPVTLWFCSNDLTTFFMPRHKKLRGIILYPPNFCLSVRPSVRQRLIIRVRSITLIPSEIISRNLAQI